jgi:hypothetical protein
MYGYTCATPNVELAVEILTHDSCSQLPEIALSSYVLESCLCWSNDSSSVCKISLHKKGRIFSGRVSLEYSTVVSFVLTVLNIMWIFAYMIYIRCGPKKNKLTKNVQFVSNTSLVTHYHGGTSKVNGGISREVPACIEDDESYTEQGEQISAHKIRRIPNLAITYQDSRV